MTVKIEEKDKEGLMRVCYRDDNIPYGVCTWIEDFSKEQIERCADILITRAIEKYKI